MVLLYSSLQLAAPASVGRKASERGCSTLSRGAPQPHQAPVAACGAAVHPRRSLSHLSLISPFAPYNTQVRPKLAQVLMRADSKTLVDGRMPAETPAAKERTG